MKERSVQIDDNLVQKVIQSKHLHRVRLWPNLLTNRIATIPGARQAIAYLEMI